MLDCLVSLFLDSTISSGFNEASRETHRMSGQDKMRRALERGPYSLRKKAKSKGRELSKSQIICFPLRQEGAGGGGMGGRRLLTMVPQPGVLVRSLIRAPFLPQELGLVRKTEVDSCLL